MDRRARAAGSRSQALAEDLQFLIDTCEAPERILSRLGFRHWSTLYARLAATGHTQLRDDLQHYKRTYRQQTS